MIDNPLQNEYNIDTFPLVPTGSGFSLYLSERHRDYYENNAFEPYTVRLVSNLLSCYSLFIDVGANYGFYSLLAGTAHPNIDILALEPTPETFQAFQRSMEKAGLSKIQALQLAAGDQDGTAAFNVSIYAGNCSFYTHPVGATLRQVEVRTVKLDTLLANRTPCPTLVKIDVEGHEMAVLEGMSETFARFPDLGLILEINPACLRSAGHEPEEMLRKLDELGYAVFLLDDQKGRHYRLDLNGDWMKFLAESGCANLYCIRKEKALSVCFFSHSSGLAGVERALLTQVSRLVRNYGVLCTVLMPSPGPLVEALEAVGASCIEAPLSWWAKAPWADLKPDDWLEVKPGIAPLLGKTLPILADVNPDIFETETLLMPWGAVSAFLLSKPHVWHIHELANGIKFIFPFKQVIEDIEGCSSLIITCSDAVGQSLFPDLGTDRRRTVYCDIPTPSAGSGKAPSGIFTRKGAVKLALFGFIEERKNQEEAILALDALVARGYDVELLLAGTVANGDYMARLNTLITERGLSDRVKLPGFLPDPFPAMAESDIVLGCAPFEGFGLTVVEAMLLSKPVVYAAAGGYLESMIDGRTGLSYPPGNIAAFADEIASLINNPQRAAEMGREGHAYASKRFGERSNGDLYFELLLKHAQTDGAPDRLPRTVEPLVKQVILEQCAASENAQTELDSVQTELRAVRPELKNTKTALLSAQAKTVFYKKAVESAQQFQRSPLKRLFHRWHPPVQKKVERKPKHGFFPRLARSIQKRRQTVSDLFSRFIVKKHPTEPLKKRHKDEELILQSGLFDHYWYRAHYEKMIRPNEDPIRHYLSEGVALGFNPSPSFNTLGYLDLYPDVANAKFNPLLHYIRAGKREKRFPNATCSADAVNEAMHHYGPLLAQMDPSKKTVLLVTHEMSRTGAPILLLNLAKHFKDQFNVVILTLKYEGALENEFTKASDVLIGPKIPQEQLHSEKFLTLLFRRIESEHPIAFAIVNSIVSHPVLKPLWENNIPYMHLIHEFAGNTRPQGLYGRSALYSSLQIFPAALVQKDAMQEAPEIQENGSIILPQGINSAPGSTKAPTQAEAEKQHIRKIFRPAAFPRNTVVIVGIGTVQIRKGVELFIACAQRVAAKHPATPFRFVWIGPGFDPDRDEYSLFIADQIRRSGLNEILAITNEVAEIETAYQESNILFLSSRLDPLPLVSQDSIAHGKPVICFEGATGMAEYLKEDPDTAFGVVSYLDIEEAANRICRLIDDGSYREKVGEACQKLAASRFCFESYVSRLETIGLELADRKAVKKADRESTAQSNRNSSLSSTNAVVEAVRVR